MTKGNNKVDEEVISIALELRSRFKYSFKYIARAVGCSLHTLYTKLAEHRKKNSLEDK